MFFTVLILAFVPALVQAQVVDPGCDPFDPACPVDGGVSFLIAAGIGIAAKKSYDRKKKQLIKQ